MEKSLAGFDVLLIPLSQDFVIGKPMLFRVEIKNISDETLGYMNTSFMVNDPMIVKDSNDTIVPYIAGDAQTGGGPEFVEPGEIIILSDNYDARSQYHIVKPGKYTFQFKGLHQTKPSNIVKMDVKAGQLSALESVVEELRKILPDNWGLTRRIAYSRQFAADTNIDGAVIVHLIGKPRHKTKDRGIGLGLYINPSQPDQGSFEGHLWGQCELGYVYANSINAELLWPNYKEQITKALDIKSEQESVDREVILETEEMPKETFLRFVEKSVDLSDEEKKIIKRGIHPTTYTHVRLSKYQQNGEMFLKIDQFYPQKFIGKDSAGHQRVTGGSGSIAVYKLKNGLWLLVGNMLYD